MITRGKAIREQQLPEHLLSPEKQQGQSLWLGCGGLSSHRLALVPGVWAEGGGQGRREPLRQTGRGEPIQGLLAPELDPWLQGLYTAARAPVPGHLSPRPGLRHCWGPPQGAFLCACSVHLVNCKPNDFRAWPFTAPGLSTGSLGVF